MEATLTMRQIAELAGVRRPVVSVWRRRSQVRGRSIPFPEPVDPGEAIARFRRDEIVAWLADTGRGNNPETALDAKATAVPSGVDLEQVVTLLCLYAATGDDLADRTAAELGALARQIDPDDEFVSSEVAAMPVQPALLRYADDLIENSYSVVDAYERLTSGRLGRQSGPRGLSPELVDLLAALAKATRDWVADPMTLAVMAEPEVGWRLWPGWDGVRCRGNDEAAVRAQRRRVVIRGLSLQPPPGRDLHLVSVVGRSDDAALEVIGDIDVDLGPGDVAIVIGGASLLGDRLTGALEKNRARVLRLGHLALAVRLPRGLWKEAHRQALGLWVLQGSRRGQSLRVADVSAERVDVDDLCSDLTATLADTGTRAFRYARTRDLADVLAGGPIVPRGVRAVRWGRADLSYVDQVYAATLTSNEPIPGFDVTVADAPGHVRLGRRSLGQLAEEAQIRVRHGNRIDLAHHNRNGTVGLLAADGSTDNLRFDPLDLERRYPRAVRTEPGDVVFLECPRPRARVDPHGGNLVMAPTRIIRLAPTAPLRPHLLAAVINELAAEKTEWPTWTIPDFTPQAADDLERVLAEAAERLDLLRRHERAVHDLTTSLIHGVAAGAVAIDLTTTKKAG